MAIATEKAPQKRFEPSTIAIRAAVGLAGIVVLFHAPVSVAQNPAPIIFANSPDGSARNAQPSTRTGARYQQVASAPISSASIVSSERRTEYRYPDQPNTVFGSEGPRRTTGKSAPIAFSSSEAAIAPSTARSYALSAKADVSEDAAPQKIGAPYQVMGRWYVPAAEPDYDEVGIGSWYGPKFHGKPTANGETFDQHAMTAAHPTLPIPSLARVTNLDNGRTIVVRINDRGPFIDNRIIDLSKHAAQAIGYHDEGKARVRVEYIGTAPRTPNSLPAHYIAQNERALQRANTSSPAPVPVSHGPLTSPNGYGAFHLQAGSFTELGNAHALRERLNGISHVQIKEARINGREYFRVMLGPWSARLEAEEMKRQLSRAGLDTVLVAAKSP